MENFLNVIFGGESMPLTKMLNSADRGEVAKNYIEQAIMRNNSVGGVFVHDVSLNSIAR